MCLPSDIMLSVCMCARYQAAPKECHLKAVKRIVRYLHWYTSVLYKRFLTPFRSGIWNRRLLSGYETVGDMPPWHTHSAK